MPQFKLEAQLHDFLKLAASLTLESISLRTVICRKPERKMPEQQAAAHGVNSR